MVKEKTKNFRYSSLRTLACVGIVFLHMFYGAVTIYGEGITELSRNISWIVVNNLYWAVPCFVMVTGALLLDPSRELTYKKLFGKYIFRVAAALLIFSVLYRVFDIWMNGEEFTASGIIKGFTDFFTGDSWSHLWYLYMVIGLYLLLPFFKKITEHVRAKELGYLLLIMVIFLSLVPILKLWNIGIGFGIPVASIYPFYLFFGYFASRPEIKISKWIVAGCLVVSTVALTMLTLLRWNNPETMVYTEIFFNYSSFIVILQATSIFCLFIKKDEEAATKKENIFKRLIGSFDQCTFGIYLVHMFFARFILRYMGINPYDNLPVFIGWILSVILVSYFVVWLLRKIPKVNKVL